jgi:hypothetical protein
MKLEIIIAIVIPSLSLATFVAFKFNKFYTEHTKYITAPIWAIIFICFTYYLGVANMHLKTIPHFDDNKLLDSIYNKAQIDIATILITGGVTYLYIISIGALADHISHQKSSK